MKSFPKLRYVLLVYILLVTLVSLLPSSGISVWHIDKIGHFLSYLGMAVLAFLAFNDRRPRVLALLFAVVLGAVLEWCQSFVPGRDMSLLDGVANTLGVISGIVLYRFRGQQFVQYADRFIK